MFHLALTSQWMGLAFAPLRLHIRAGLDWGSVESDSMKHSRFKCIAASIHLPSMCVPSLKSTQRRQPSPNDLTSWSDSTCWYDLTSWYDLTYWCDFASWCHSTYSYDSTYWYVQMIRHIDMTRHLDMTRHIDVTWYLDMTRHIDVCTWRVEECAVKHWRTRTYRTYPITHIP